MTATWWCRRSTSAAWRRRRQTYQRVVSEKTSARDALPHAAQCLEGSGTRMNKFAAGYRAGGKTGTAEKVVNGRYE